MHHVSPSSNERAEGAAPVSTRGRYLESVAVGALRDEADMERILTWVAGLRQGAILPWEGGVITLSPATPSARAAVSIGLFRRAAPSEIVRGTVDLPCDVLIGDAVIDREDLARIQAVAGASPTVYAPRFTAAARHLRRMAEALALATNGAEGRNAGSPPADSRPNDAASAESPRLAALRTGDGEHEQAVFVARPHESIARIRRLVARPASAHATLDAASFVATAERRLRGPAHARTT